MNWKQYDFRYELDGVSGIHTVTAMDLNSAYIAVRKSLGKDAKIDYPEIKPANLLRRSRA